MNVVVANVCLPREIFDSMTVMSSMMWVHWSSGYKDKEHLFTQIFAQKDLRGSMLTKWRKVTSIFAVSVISKGLTDETWYATKGYEGEHYSRFENGSQLYLSNEH